MAITNNKAFAWEGKTSAACINVDVSTLSSNLLKFYGLNQDGSSFVGSETGLSVINCGSAYLLFSQNVPYDLPSAVESTSVGGDSLELKSPVVESFIYTGDQVSGTFHLTSHFVNERATYMTEDGSWYIWFDGTQYILSNTKYTKDDLFYESGSEDPTVENYGFLDTPMACEDGLTELLIEDGSFLISEYDNPNFVQGGRMFTEAGVMLLSEAGVELFAETDSNPIVTIDRQLMNEDGSAPLYSEGYDYFELESAY